MKKVGIMLLSLFLLAGCGAEKVSENEAFSLNYNNLNIALNEKFTKDKFGEELSYAETENCAFEGIGKTYQYDHYEIATYTENNEEKIMSIYFLDSDITTTEGLAIADDITKMENLYGKDYTLENGVYIYTKGNTSLKVIAQDDQIISIEYVLNEK